LECLDQENFGNPALRRVAVSMTLASGTWDTSSNLHARAWRIQEKHCCCVYWLNRHCLRFEKEK
jgi:hypothetical protein